MGSGARLNAGELLLRHARVDERVQHLGSEIEHLKERLSVEEDAELELMEEVEARDEAVRRAELEAQRVQAESDASAPELRGQLEKARLDLVEAEAERATVWADIPAPARAL